MIKKPTLQEVVAASAGLPLVARSLWLLGTDKVTRADAWGDLMSLAILAILPATAVVLLARRDIRGVVLIALEFLVIALWPVAREVLGSGPGALALGIGATIATVAAIGVPEVAYLAIFSLRKAKAERRGERVDLNARALILDTAGRKLGVAMTENLSAGGICLFTSHKVASGALANLRPGSSVRVRLAGPRQDFEVNATIAWSRINNLVRQVGLCVEGEAMGKILQDFEGRNPAHT